jgi:hypothetical protein
VILNEDDLKELFQASILDKVPSTGKNCPSLQEIRNIFIAGVSNRQKIRLLDHLTGCSHCYQTFVFLLQIYREEMTLDQDLRHVFGSEIKLDSSRKRGPLPSPFQYLSWSRMSLLTGTLILIVSFAIFGPKLLHRHPQPEKRGNILSSIELQEPLHLSKPQLTLQFKWSAWKDADYYLLELYDEALVLIWISDRIYGNECLLPPAVFRTLVDKKTYFWMVTAFQKDQKKAESRLEDFSLEGRSGREH